MQQYSFKLFQIITAYYPVFCIGMTSSAEAIEDDVVDDQSCVISLEESEEDDVEDSMSVGSVKDEEHSEEEESLNDTSELSSVTQDTNDRPPCEFFGQVPCDVVTFWDDICEVCDDYKDTGMENNQV